MNQFQTSVLGASQQSSLEVSKMLKNTYALLSMTLIFSGIMAYISISMGVGQGMAMFASLGAIGLLWFVLPRTANSSAGIPIVFTITGLFGLGLGPMLNYYLAINPSIVTTALGGTGMIFLGLSAYALITRKDFSFMGGFLMVGMFVVIGAAIANIFLQMPVLSLMGSGAIVMIMSGFILFETSNIIRGGETNYIMATASLFLSLLNMFQALLQILGVLGDD